MGLVFVNPGLVEKSAAFTPPGQVALLDKYREDLSDRAVGKLAAATLQYFLDVVSTYLPGRPNYLHELEFHLSECS